MYCHPLVLFSKEHLNSNVAECLKTSTQTAHGLGGGGPIITESRQAGTSSLH